MYMYIRSDGTSVEGYKEKYTIEKSSCECCGDLVKEAELKEVANLIICENCQEDYDTCEVCGKEYHYEEGLFDENNQSMCICSNNCLNQTKIAV